MQDLLRQKDQQLEEQDRQLGKATHVRGHVVHHCWLVC